MSTQPRPLPRDRAAARRELVQLLAERLVREALAKAASARETSPRAVQHPVAPVAGAR